MKKHLVAIGIASTVGLTGIAGVGVANAATDTTNSQDSLVSAIATKFNLNKTDVQKVFEDEHAAREVKQETRVNDKLAQLVKDGKLTQSQADALKTKRAEVKKEREANRPSIGSNSKTHEDMKTEIEKKRTELESWATNQGISKDYLHFVFGGGHRGPGGPR